MIGGNRTKTKLEEMRKIHWEKQRKLRGRMKRKRNKNWKIILRSNITINKTSIK